MYVDGQIAHGLGSHTHTYFQGIAVGSAYRV